VQKRIAAHGESVFEVQKLLQLLRMNDYARQMYLAESDNLYEQGYYENACRNYAKID
jgi:hypothetical protein